MATGRMAIPSTQRGSGVLEDLIGAAPPAEQASRPQPPAPEPAGSKQEKLPAYAPHWLIERLRNAVVAMQRMPEAEAEAPATLSALCQAACLREVQRLEAEYNSGEPFPERSRRKLRTGRPIQ